MLRTWARFLATAVAVFPVAVAMTFLTTGQGSLGSGKADAILVLGTPARPDGTASEKERWRVDEAIREYRRGVAERVILSGGAAANRFVEADAMAAYALKQGLPAEATLKEGRSLTTMENIRNSREILLAHGWRHVEVISAPDHLRRAAVLLGWTDLVWRLHPAPTPGRTLANKVYEYSANAFGTAVLRWFGPKAEEPIHAFASFAHRAAHRLRHLR